MRKFYYVIKNRGKEQIVDIYKLKDNDLSSVARLRNFRPAKGYESDVFNHLMEIGEIPKKYNNSSVEFGGNKGYFQGKVRELYQIREL